MEETEDFIKQIINNGKNEQQKELAKFAQDVDRVRLALSDKCSLSELLDCKAKLYSALESKVALKEVQGALNDCQGEICEQLAEFKKGVSNDMH